MKQDECPVEGCTAVQVSKGKEKVLLTIFIALFLVMFGSWATNTFYLSSINSTTTSIKEKYNLLEKKMELVEDQNSAMVINQQLIVHKLNEVRRKNNLEEMFPPLLYNKRLFQKETYPEDNK